MMRREGGSILDRAWLNLFSLEHNPDLISPQSCLALSCSSLPLFILIFSLGENQRFLGFDKNYCQTSV